MPKVTPTAVGPASADTPIESGIGGEAIAAGKFIFQDPSTNRWFKSDSTVQSKAKVGAVALTECSGDGGVFAYMEPGNLITFGTGLLSAGRFYVLLDDGDFGDVEDLGGTNYAILVGASKSADNFEFRVYNTETLHT